MKDYDIYFAGDYAGLKTDKFSAYYGYEETSLDEWCFVAKFNDEKIKLPCSKLGMNDMFDCKDGLIRGLAWVFENYILEKQTKIK